MAEPGDHKPEVETDALPPEPEAAPAPFELRAADFDETVGFASPNALVGRTVRGPVAPAAPEADAGLSLGPIEPLTTPVFDTPQVEAPGADMIADAPIADAPPVAAPLFASPLSEAPSAEPALDVGPAMVATAPVAAAAYDPIPSREERRRMRDLEAAAPADDRMLWAYTVYALILFAVPTLGVSAAIGVLAVTGRAVKAEEPLKSHYIFQQRTLWSAAVMAIIGLVLIPIGLGVFVLFAAAVWILARGAFGLLRLKAGRAIDNPRSWLL